MHAELLQECPCESGHVENRQGLGGLHYDASDVGYEDERWIHWYRIFSHELQGCYEIIRKICLCLYQAL